MKNIFDQSVTAELINRINKLSATTPAVWGTMSVAQMLAHCNVTYELIYEEDKHPRPNFLLKFILKNFVKKTVTSEAPYKHSLKTAPAFIIKDKRDFETEKGRLITHIDTTQQLGEAYFDGKESHSFGHLTLNEWNIMFYKHLDHHLQQFGV